MARNAGICIVHVGGVSIMSTLTGVLQSVSVTDRAGTSSDTATIVVDDKDGLIAYPPHNAKVDIFLGFESGAAALVFSGNVDEVRSSGGRSGQTIQIEAKGLDTSSKAKEPQQRHFDDMSVLDILTAAGSAAGITDIRVDPTLAGIIREYEHMDDESFIAFGERLAGEIGGTFKIRNDAAIMALKNSGRTPSGAILPPVIVTAGENLHSWDVSPYIGRPRYKQIRVRFYDAANAVHDEVVVDTGVQGSDAIDVGRFEAPNEAMATEKANALKAESERNSGVGTVTIEGNAGAQPEAYCTLFGTRIGIDGIYVIDGVDHRFSRGTGFTTKIGLGYPL